MRLEMASCLLRHVRQVCLWRWLCWIQSASSVEEPHTSLPQSSFVLARCCSLGHGMPVAVANLVPVVRGGAASDVVMKHRTVLPMPHNKLSRSGVEGRQPAMHLTKGIIMSRLCCTQGLQPLAALQPWYCCHLSYSLLAVVVLHAPLVPLYRGQSWPLS
jgi:hypothetical protein